MVEKEHMIRGASEVPPKDTYEKYEVLKNYPERRIFYPNPDAIARGLVVLMEKDLVEILKYREEKIISWKVPGNLSIKEFNKLMVENEAELIFLKSKSSIYPLPLRKEAIRNSKHFDLLFERNGILLFKVRRNS
jgi:hypothetical protein